MDQLKRGERPSGAGLIVGEYGRTTELTEVEKAEALRRHMEGAELRWVVPIAKSMPWEGKKLTLVSLELYTDGTVLNHLVVRLPGEDSFFRNPNRDPTSITRINPDFRVEDNVGTSYSVGFGGSGGGNVLRGETRITPAIPDEATELRLFVKQVLEPGRRCLQPMRPASI
jgi:hypothetical protein